ncbi:MAG: GNAT family N-acetyltransferase [Deltaproteobacteria bacterium]|nr:MAG: GNAT family N-acetyltransferase [Deltaproteobacteria bacterium]
MEPEGVKIRVLDYKDLDDIVEIERLILGKDRKDYWLMKIELSEERSPMASLVAEVNGKVIGFIIGEVAGWEYGVPDTVAWIDTIGVHPDYQKKGIATLLFKKLLQNLRKVGITTIYTFVEWRSWDLLRFFAKMGFEKGDMIHLCLRLKD